MKKDRNISQIWLLLLFYQSYLPIVHSICRGRHVFSLKMFYSSSAGGNIFMRTFLLHITSTWTDKTVTRTLLLFFLLKLANIMWLLTNSSKINLKNPQVVKSLEATSNSSTLSRSDTHLDSVPRSEYHQELQPLNTYWGHMWIQRWTKTVNEKVKLNNQSKGLERRSRLFCPSRLWHPGPVDLFANTRQ